MRFLIWNFGRVVLACGLLMRSPRGSSFQAGGNVQGQAQFFQANFHGIAQIGSKQPGRGHGNLSDQREGCVSWDFVQDLGYS